MRRSACLVSSLCLVEMLCAQRTWVVDSANRPGTHFTDLPPALLAANHGDTILVRAPGPSFGYTGGRTTKGITLLGVGGPLIQPPPATLETLVVSGVPTGETFTMKGFGLPTDLFSVMRLQFRSCAGRVHLEDLPANWPAWYRTLEIIDCAQVSTLRCDFGGLDLFSMKITRSVVALTETRSTGFSAFAAVAHGHCQTGPSAPGLEAVDSVVTVAGGTFTGGNGIQGCATWPPSAAIVQSGGVLRITGDANTRLYAGTPYQVPTIAANRGTVWLDPDVQLVPRSVGGTSTVLPWSAPYLTGRGAGAGAPAPLDLFATAGDVLVLMASRPADPLVADPLGSWWLALDAFVVGVTVLGTTPRWQLTLPVPPGTLDGMPFAFQALALTGPNLIPALSNPLVLVLH